MNIELKGLANTIKTINLNIFFEVLFYGWFGPQLLPSFNAKKIGTP